MSAEFSAARRRFIQLSVVAGTGLTLGITVPARGEEPAGTGRDTRAFQPNIWLRVGTDNRVVIFVNESEMGQGVQTALPMLVAEELEVDWAMVRVEPAPLDPGYGFQLTGGSTSVRNAWQPLREAGAAAREMLLAAAASTWSVPKAECVAADSHVVHEASGRKASYGELAPLAAQQEIPTRIPLKTPDQYRIIGQPLRRLDVPDHLTGKTVYGIDVQVPGMLYAAIRHCPVFDGRPGTIRSDKAQTFAGVRHILPMRNGVAVVADDYWSALKADAALEIEWRPPAEPAPDSDGIRRLFVEALGRSGKVARSDGDVAAALRQAHRRIEAVYDVPYQAHASMEPMCCTAHVHDGGCEIWVPTQSPSMARDEATKVLASRVSTIIESIKARFTDTRENIVVHPTAIGGGFGRRLNQDYVIEAVEISKAVRAPVKLIWSREEDIQHDFYRPSSVHRLVGVLDAQGTPVAWQHRIAGQSVGASGAQDLPYRIANVAVESVDVELAVPTGAWRSVAHSYNAFVKESFIDELAHAAGQDPVAFRLRLLDAEPRLKAVLQLAADRAGWGGALPEGHHQGVAVHESFGSRVAQVARVSVDDNGAIRVHRVICAVDCGTVINPDIVSAQMEGAVVFGLTATLKGAISIHEGCVQQSNFHDFPLLSLAEAPVVETHLVASTAPPGGIGEPGVPPIAPAVANAVYAATGIRVRQLPILPAHIRAAPRSPRQT